MVVGPPQDEVDRHLSLYEAYVRTDVDRARPAAAGDGVVGVVKVGR